MRTHLLTPFALSCLFVGCAADVGESDYSTQNDKVLINQETGETYRLELNEEGDDIEDPPDWVVDNLEGQQSAPASGAAYEIAGPDRPDDILDCTTQQENDLGAAMDFGADNWSAFEAFVEGNSDINVKNCLENRFTSNGKVVCEWETAGMCENPDGTVNGWASPLNKRAHFCPYFFNFVSGLSQSERRACYFALLAHEWAHTCDRDHGTIETIDDLAFDYYKQENPSVSIDLDDCNMD